tara:strand:- start:130 stop:366 length:237 start_codon:yes stop_codon:yes gene_type:complete
MQTTIAGKNLYFQIVFILYIRYFFAAFLLGLVLVDFFVGAAFFFPIKSSVIDSIVFCISIFHPFISYRSNNLNNFLGC